MPAVATTELPNEDQLTLGNGVEDEIAVDRESAVSDYGSVRLHYRETGASEWIDWGVVPYDRLDPVVAGLEDGERYEVRLRTETEHVIGDWTDPVAITTQFPGATALTVTATTATSATLQFDDNADNETGVDVERRERFRDGWGEWRHVTTLDPNPGTGTVEWTDDTVLPDTTYQWRVRPFTEHSAATSEPTEITTDDDGVQTSRVPAQDWHVELETDEGVVHTPTVLSGATPKASLNDVPRVEIPVPESDRWRDEDLLRCEMRVWRDGERLPIERFERPVSEPGRVVLHGRGGIALDADITVDQGEVRDVDDLAEAVVADETPYLGHFDDPAADLRDDITVLSADQATRLDETLPALDGVTRDQSIPAYVAVDGTVETAQICWLQSAQAADARDTAPGTIIDDGGETYMSDRAYRLESVGDYVEWEFDAEFAVDAAEFAARLRYRVPNEGAHPELTVTLNGQQIDFRVADVPGFGGNTLPAWYEFQTIDNYTSGTLTGSQTLRVEVTAESAEPDGHWLVDGSAPYAGEFADQLDFSLGTGADAIDADGIIAGPQTYPETVELLTTEQSMIQQVVAGALDVELDDTSGAQSIAVSNDGGETWLEASNSESVSGEFDSPSTRIQGRITLSRSDGDPSVHPRTGGAGQTLDTFDLQATLDDTPFVRGYADSGTVLEVLQNLADTHWSIFEVWWDPDANGGDGGIAIEWTQPGQREATTDAEVIDYETETDAETVVEAAWVYGRSRRVRDQAVELVTSGYQSIGDGYIQPGTERVFTVDADGNPDEVFAIGDDYEMRYNEGAIKAVAGGGISDGQTVRMDYETRIAAYYQAPDADGSGDTIRETVAEATTENLAQQAAMALVKELGEPLEGATVTLDRTADINLVGALDVDGVPADAEVVRDMEASGGEQVVQLGNRYAVGRAVDEIRRRVSAVAKRL